MSTVVIVGCSLALIAWGTVVAVDLLLTWDEAARAEMRDLGSADQDASDT